MIGDDDHRTDPTDRTDPSDDNPIRPMTIHRPPYGCRFGLGILLLPFWPRFRPPLGE